MNRSHSYQFTARWKNRVNLYDDTKRMRLVVYRRVGRITKKTSVRYRSQSREAAQKFATALARKLRAWPASRLAEFSFARA